MPIDAPSPRSTIYHAKPNRAAGVRADGFAAAARSCCCKEPWPASPNSLSASPLAASPPAHHQRWSASRGMSITERLSKEGATVRKPGRALLVIIPALIAAIGAAAILLGNLPLPGHDITGYGIDAIVAGANPPDGGAAAPSP